MAAKKKRLGKIRIKSLKRVVISSVFLIAAIIALLVVRNGVFSGNRKEIAAKPSAVAKLTKDDINDNVKDNTKDNTDNNTNDNKKDDSKDDTEENPATNEVSDVAIAANASLASSDEAMKEIGEIIAKNKGVSVNVINNSQKPGLSEKVRAVLEVNGFSVSAGNDKSLKHVNSVIIEKKDDISGEDISKLLNIRRIRKEPDPDSRFDIVVVIGDDYN